MSLDQGGTLMGIGKFLFFGMACLVAPLTGAAGFRDFPIQSRPPLLGGTADLAKAPGDSTPVMGPWGSGAPYNGQFQTPGGLPAWNGWTSRDFTRPESNRWHADTYHAVNGAYSAWCGSADYPACGAGDEAGGYGNSWNDPLQWTGPVADPGLSCTVGISALLNHDIEPGYDFLHLECVLGNGSVVQLASWDGTASAVSVNETFTYLPGDYSGSGGDEVVVRFRFESDGGWSDEDCLHPTRGAAQVDDLVITLTNGAGAQHDFEDGTLGPFQAPILEGVGNFAKIWTGLNDSDPCRSNFGPQVAFIDDGVVVPGTGGSLCIDHCYGPNGHVVNSTGGLAGPDEHLDNGIISPVMAWPAGHHGMLLEFTVFEDDFLFALNDDPGILYSWHVRSTVSADPADILDAPWVNRGFFQINDSWDGRYVRQSYVVGDLLEPGARSVQAMLKVLEIGFAWGQNGTNALPAPFFDDVRITAYESGGPNLTANRFNLALDAFPASGTVDLSDPGALWARFDGGRGADPSSPGDSVVVDAKPARAGAVLTGPPLMHYRLRPNPVFDPFRTSGLPLTGAVAGLEGQDQLGEPNGRFAFDLPDTGFLFPGDVLRYCFTASDDLGGVIAHSLMPADTTGFSSGEPGLVYEPDFTVRVLPAISEDPGNPGSYLRPDLLIWSDAEGDQEYDLWVATLGQMGLQWGRDFDLATRPAAQARMADRIRLEQLASYDDLIYLTGSTFQGFLPDEDVLLLEAWFATGGRDLLAMGLTLAGNLKDIYGWGSGSGIGATFALNRMGIADVDRNVNEMISDQDFPQIAPLAGNPVLGGGFPRWRDNAQCQPDGRIFPNTRQGNGVIPAAGATVLAEYTSPGGGLGSFPYAAALLHEVAADSSRSIMMPTTLRRIYPDPDAAKTAAPPATRTQLVQAILGYFGRSFTGAPSAVPGAEAFTVSAYPNPFNPTTTLSYTMPQAGRLSLKVFDLRGRLVRKLLDERREAGPGLVIWNGLDEAGARVPSGVYFYEARTAGQVQVGRVTMIK